MVRVLLEHPYMAIVNLQKIVVEASKLRIGTFKNCHLVKRVIENKRNTTHFVFIISMLKGIGSIKLFWLSSIISVGGIVEFRHKFSWGWNVHCDTIMIKIITLPSLKHFGYVEKLRKEVSKCFRKCVWIKLFQIIPYNPLHITSDNL